VHATVTKLASHRQHGWNLRTLLVATTRTSKVLSSFLHSHRRRFDSIARGSACWFRLSGEALSQDLDEDLLWDDVAGEKTATQSPVIGNKSSLTLDIHQCGNVFGEKTTVSRGTDAEVLRFIVQTFEASVKGSPVAAAFALSLSSELLFLHPAVALLILLDTSSRFTEYLLAVGLAVHVLTAALAHCAHA